MPRHPALILAVVALFMGCGRVSSVRSQEIFLQEAPRPTATDISERADSLLFAMAPVEAFDLLEARLEWRPEDYDAQWRASRLAVVLGVMESDRERRAMWYRVAEFHGLGALKTRDRAIEGLVWTAAAKGRRAIETGGARDKARLGSEVWELTRRVLEEFPDHPLANDVRGKLNLEVMRLDSFSRFIGKMILRSDLLRYASWESAEGHFMKAIEGDPGMVLFYLDLGETYFDQEMWSEATLIFERGLGIADRYPTDPQFKAKMRGRLERMREANRGL